MIKSEHIPAVAADTLFANGHFIGDRADARRAIVAVLEAWPGVVDHPETVISPRCLWLPLTQENNNGSD